MLGVLQLWALDCLEPKFLTSKMGMEVMWGISRSEVRNQLYTDTQIPAIYRYTVGLTLTVF